MIERTFERRDFLRCMALLGAASALPLPLPALARSADWPKVRALLGSLAPARVPGLAAAIGRGTEEPRYLFAGTLAKDSRAKIDADTLWRVYSMTKPITGIAAMMLVEDGKLTLDQNIADFIPGFADPKVLTDPGKSLTSRLAKGPVTVRHLLTHTSGLSYSFVLTGPLRDEYLRLGLSPVAISRTRTLDELLGVGQGERAAHATAPSLKEFADRIATLPLLADPGAAWTYSVGLDVLARVIEVASGKPFDAFLQERMFDPLGMRSSFWRVPGSEKHRLVTTQYISARGVEPLDPGATSVFLDPPAFPFGGAGLVMSARDYDRFLMMLMGQGAIGGARVMKPETAKLAMSDLLPDGVDRKTFDQGFGAGGHVLIRPDAEGRSAGSFGWAGAAGTVAWVDPVRGIRALGYSQAVPPDQLGFSSEFPKAVYADLA